MGYIWPVNLETRNTNPEIRNKSEIRIFQCSKQYWLKLQIRTFGHLKFENCFEFRYSNFGFIFCQKRHEFHD